ncbi:hypothetical protein N0B44_02310 [Roseibacterium beibuensis]|uniref:von Hippel-Lindau disease tumour suppressor beta domain-containing protein n=1 Tax=[Roseibacterium] beibuensis TaxID=1193142 RepID=A0ABP9KYG2_9RHOB|nr:hypothetical protein [Roseibacterium beibuensis]MCS6621736.1 hypothetical protein [Roseibacterium beibuensis]
MPGSRFFKLSAALLALSSAPSFAQVTGYEWSYFRDIQPNPMNTVMALRLGVPETDDVVLEARCELTSGPQVSFNFAADAGAIPLETDVDFTVTPEGLNPSTVPATTRATEFIGGVFIDRTPTDPFNFALVAAPVLTWAIDGQASFTVDASVNQHIAGRFLYECAHFGSQQPDPNGDILFPVAAEAAPGGGDMAAASSEPGAMSCDQLGQAVSTGGGAPLTVTFENASDGGRGLSWVASDGSVQDLGFLDPGASTAFFTFVGHVWMITDGPGNCLEMFSPVAGQERFRITRPGQFFGNE